MQTAVAGVSGYAGMELARLLLHHPGLAGQPPVFVGREPEAVRLSDMHPQLAGRNVDAMVEPFSWELLERRGVELLFLATPHEQSRSWVPEALAHGLRVVDLSGAWRLQVAAHRAIYGFADADAALAEAGAGAERLWFAGVASRVHCERPGGSEPWLLCNFGHFGVAAADGIVGSGSRDHLRCQVRRVRSW